MPPMSAASPGSRPITASDFKALKNINQKIDGMATRLLTIEQHVSMAPQNPPQLLVRDHLHLGTSMRQWLSTGQPRPYTSGVRSRLSSVSHEEDLDGYGDSHEPEADHLEDD